MWWKNYVMFLPCLNIISRPVCFTYYLDSEFPLFNLTAFVFYSFKIIEYYASLSNSLLVSFFLELKFPFSLSFFRFPHIFVVPFHHHIPATLSLPSISFPIRFLPHSSSSSSVSIVCVLNNVMQQVAR